MDWNFVAKSWSGRFWRMCSLLGPYGEIEQTDQFNVVVGRVQSPLDIPAQLVADLGGTKESLFSIFVRMAPSDVAFRFANTQEMRKRLNEASLAWSGKLRGRNLCVQITRHRPTISGEDYESWLQVITDTLFDSFRSAKSIVPYAPGDEVPEYVLVVESIADRIGLSLWTSEDAARFPLLERGQLISTRR